jgi:hypothetical protein
MLFYWDFNGISMGYSGILMGFEWWISMLSLNGAI